jgi:hypothetical protein
MMRQGRMALIGVACLALACASPAPSPVQGAVRASLQKINAREGNYFSNVRSILKADGGVEALIAETRSPDIDISHRANELLHMISRPPWEKRVENPDWSAWWKSTGSKMTFAQLWRNFDAYHT